MKKVATLIIVVVLGWLLSSPLFAEYDYFTSFFENKVKMEKAAEAAIKTYEKRHNINDNLKKAKYYMKKAEDLRGGPIVSWKKQCNYVFKAWWEIVVAMAEKDFQNLNEAQKERIIDFRRDIEGGTFGWTEKESAARDDQAVKVANKVIAKINQERMAKYGEPIGAFNAEVIRTTPDNAQVTVRSSSHPTKTSPPIEKGYKPVE
jgi:hypothetical protein